MIDLVYARRSQEFGILYYVDNRLYAREIGEVSRKQ